jgi:hypothetical protein
MTSQLRRDERATGEQRARPSVVSEIGRGIQGGAIGTFVMTAFRLPLMRSLPPSADFWAKFVSDGEPEDYPVVGLVLHLVYGVTAGVTFGCLYALLDSERAVEAEARGLVCGGVFGMVLSAFGSRVMLRALLDIELEADELTLFHAGHLVYGITLGAWVGSRAEGTDDPEEEYDYE